MSTRKTVGEHLVDLLEARGVDTVFGIPGVHTVELYRGLATSKIRHVTPRHEGSAGFMADGYARVAGKPGVCFLITGPGLTNVITAMGQARADSIPMLVISGVNRRATLGNEVGHLHELPDQAGMMRTVALYTHTLLNGADLPAVLDRAFAAMLSARPGPVHIEVPIDVMSEVIDLAPYRPLPLPSREPGAAEVEAAAALAAPARAPVILAGGGAKHADAALRRLAEHLDAPVVTTVNGRGLLAGHPLEVPASPSRGPVRDLIAASDLVIAVGTQIGPTDYDIDLDGKLPKMARLIRIDVDALQATRGAVAEAVIIADAEKGLEALAARLGPVRATGAARAAAARKAAFDGLSAKMKGEVEVIRTITAALPGAAIVGDSTQLVYAGNYYAEISRPGAWFNAATGFGSLGYGPSAAIGAALADPDGRPVVCLVGDGGFQFCLSDIGAAVDEKARVIFLVWNNTGYGEIESYMIQNRITPVGVRPSAPDFAAVAKAYGMPAEALDGVEGLKAALERAAAAMPSLIEVRLP
ncbi:MAG TPA: 5-guanidino-2-oxopentanoate decarboxylase [Albidovulum sp.]|uniref:5-guanidino-2-oxopentanoate decarboxylase n=1 Tax=Albidovulum sp. TaxID=1872424 RepID=UPI002C27F81B|nr:5-guanidino-2-oxopentanoate decarboxylase [Albidovulum sp.]